MPPNRRKLLTAVGSAVDRESTTGLRTTRPAGGLDGDSPSSGPAAPSDQLAAFRPLITSIRWGTLAVGFAVAVSSHRDAVSLAPALVLGLYALGSSFRPLRFRWGHRLDVAAVLAEVALTGAVVVATGSWSSPYFFCLITAVVATGFTSGSIVSICTASAATLAVAVPFHLRTTAADVRLTVLGGCELLLVAMVSGYARRLFGEAEARASMAMDRIARLSEANELLHQLHRVAQTLPASLDLTEVVTSTALRLHELFHPDVIAVLLPARSGAWSVATAKGARLGDELTTGDLPDPMRRAAATRRPQLVDGGHDATDASDGGLSPTTRSAIYVPLVARNALVGLMAVESDETGRFAPRHVDLLEALTEPVSLAIDNARWFARLRTVGADEERTRIARDLHDRLGQSLAYLAFELDRIADGAAGHPLHDDVVALRHDVRRVVTEVRSTLYDLRTDVSEDHDLPATLDPYLRRVAERAGLRVSMRAAANGRLPLPQERELWRIAQEAITNAERHAMAEALTVTWECDAMGAVLEVVDDGIGFAPDGHRPDAYGLLGMRERADSVGATLTVRSAPGAGTVVRCELPRTSASQ